MRRKRFLNLWLPSIIPFLLLLFSSGATAQIFNAAIHGTVTDQSGAVVPGAKITALDTATGISTTTTSDKSGYFTFTSLQVGGPYIITIETQGFQKFSTSGLTLTANANREVDVKLVVGGQLQTVQVEASAVQVETSNTQLEQVANSEQLESLPLAGRDPVGMQKLAPGVMESSDRDGTFASNGSEDEQNNYLLDGTDINDSALQNEGFVINPDALQEVNVVSSTMNPEFSRNSGAVVNEVVKSGTNQIHGSGFEFYRDTFLDAIPYFSTLQPVFHQNLYGGTLGFPVIKNKLFGFLAYQGLRNRTAQAKSQQTMTPTNFSGDFSDDTNWANGFGLNSAVGLSSNPIPFSFGSCTAGEAWSTCFPTGSSIIIPPTEWNSLASTLITNYVPHGNADSDTFYNFNALNTEASDQGVVRVDYTATSDDKIWASGMFQAEPSYNELAFGGGSFPGFAQVNDEHYKIFSADWTHAFSSSLLNDLHGGYYRFNSPSVIPAQPLQPSTLGFNINPELAQGAGVPYIGIGGLFNLGFSFEGPQPRTDTNLTYADSVTVVRGNHTLKFGGSFEQFRVRNPFGYYNNGSYSFYGGLTGGGEYSSGDPLIDFVLGIPDTYSQTNDGFIDAVANEIYGYGQDNWKVTQDLTFNYGLAWDVEQPFQNRQYNGYGIICYAVSSATSKVYTGGPPGLFWNGDPGCNQAGGVPTRWDHFGPRIGFAWSPSSGPSAIFGEAGSHNFSLRGGFGIYYNRDQEEQSLQNLGDPPSLLESHGAADFVESAGSPLGPGYPGSPAFANPFADVSGYGSESNRYPYTPPKPGGAVNWSYFQELDLSAVASTYDVPYAYNYNLNIQRALPGAMIMQIGYVGSMGHRLATWYEGDPITAAGHAACLANPTCVNYISGIHGLFPQYTAQPALAPSGNPWYWSVADQNSEGASNYNSLQASLVKSPTHGLQFTLAYTYSHALDNTSGYEDATGGDATYGNAGRVYNYVPGFQYLNYGDSDYDARQRLVASYVYTVPVAGFLKSNTFVREALSGWGVSGLTAVQDGFPISVTMGADESGWCDGYSYFGCPDVPETSSFKIQRYNPRTIRTQGGVSGNYYFDTTPFSPEPVGTFGNVKRNFFHGPGFNYTNLDLVKNLPLTADGARYVQLRIEAFNAFNHANFAPPGGSYANSANYGMVWGQVNSVIYSADPNGDPQPARAFQLVGKVYF